MDTDFLTGDWWTFTAVSLGIMTILDNFATFCMIMFSALYVVR